MHMQQCRMSFTENNMHVFDKYSRKAMFLMYFYDVFFKNFEISKVGEMLLKRLQVEHLAPKMKENSLFGTKPQIFQVTTDSPYGGA